mmetsp:Transcript_17547/g.55540  ORF Transcript_17547/g.55540 Transcript_17547/m.55540 type:complete len:270 (+) Transcript_17547:1823-2632(+)
MRGHRLRGHRVRALRQRRRAGGGGEHRLPGRLPHVHGLRRPPGGALAARRPLRAAWCGSTAGGDPPGQGGRLPAAEQPAAPARRGARGRGRLAHRGAPLGRDHHLHGHQGLHGLLLAHLAAQAGHSAQLHVLGLRRNHLQLGPAQGGDHRRRVLRVRRLPRAQRRGPPRGPLGVRHAGGGGRTGLAAHAAQRLRRRLPADARGPAHGLRRCGRRGQEGPALPPLRRGSRLRREDGEPRHARLRPGQRHHPQPAHGRGPRVRVRRAMHRD